MQQKMEKKMNANEQAEIEALEARIERMVEDQSKYEALAHAGGVEVGKELKTLTDEEIYKIANSIETIQPQHGLKLSNDLNVMEFARAILRKAQEK